MANTFEMDQQDQDHGLLGAFLVCISLFVASAMYQVGGHLPLSVYAADVMVVEAVGHSRFWLVVVLAALSPVLCRHSWRTIGFERRNAAIVAAPVIALSWALISREENFFVQTAHQADRVILLTLSCLLLWRPMFLGPYLLQVNLMVGEVSHPFSYWYMMWTDKQLAFDALVVVQVYSLIRSIRPKLQIESFYLAMLVCFGAFYLRPAVAKLSLGGWMENDLSNLFLSAVHQNAWFWHLDAPALQRVAATLKIANPFLLAATLVIQFSVVLVALNRKLSLLIVASCVVFHFGIFISSGIFFWKWIAVDIALFAVLVAMPRESATRVFSLPSCGLALLCMLFGLGIYRAPIALAWHDSPLAVKFLIEAEGKSGVSYQMPPSSLAPYDLVFAQGRFHFMDDEKAIIGVLGASSDRQVVDHLKDVEDLAALNELKENKGTPRLDVARTEDFKRLVRARLHLEHSDAPNLFSRMPRPPQHIWSYSDPRFGWDEYTGQEPIRRVRVRRIEAIHTNGNNRILSNKVLCEFDV